MMKHKDWKWALSYFVSVLDMVSADRQAVSVINMGNTHDTHSQLSVLLYVLNTHILSPPW